MRHPTNRIRAWLALLAVVLCVFAQAACAGGVTNPGQFLDQAEHFRTIDHSRFAQLLAQIHREAPRLDPAEQWHLRYLDAWETMYEGDYTGSADLFRGVAEHSGDAALEIKASALLMNNLGINRDYREAFELANRLTKRLPEVKDAEARFILLDYLSQTMSSAGQTSLAVKYAHMMETAVPAGGSLCRPLSQLVSALDAGGKLALHDPELQRAIAVCTGARQPVFVDSLQLIQVDLLLDNHLSRQALALLGRIAPGIRDSNYYPYRLWLLAYRADAYAKLGEDDAASKAALAVLAMARPGDTSWALLEAFKLLYRIEKKQGHAAAALRYYEKFVGLNNAGHDDTSARALAYQTVQQHVLMQKLETEKLSRQNAELRMRQALDAKTAEADRLYLLLLLMAMGFGALWMFRLKRAQLRFQRLSNLDSLTAIFNRQYFMDEAARVLRQLERQRGRACMVFVDLDHFKQINDTYGHAAGDEVLRQVVATFRKHLRAGDLFGRLGGEEFGILLPGCASSQAVALAERIRSAIDADPCRVGDADVPVSISVGVSATRVCGYDLRCLCTEADAALYRAKRAGRNRVAASEEEGMIVDA